MKYNKILLIFSIFFIILVEFKIISMGSQAYLKANQDWQMAQASFDSFKFDEAKVYLESVAGQRHNRSLQFMALLELAKIYLGQEVGTTWKTKFNVEIDKAKNMLDQLEGISPYSLNLNNEQISNLIAQRSNLLLIEKNLEEKINYQKRKLNNNGNGRKSQKQY